MKKRRFPVACCVIGLLLAVDPLGAKPTIFDLLLYWGTDVFAAFLVFHTTTPPSSEAIARQAPVVTVPFTQPLSFQLSPASVTIFARDVNGAYISLQFDPTTGSLQRPPANVTQWLSGGTNTVFDAPPGPPGIGLQSQSCAISAVGNDGWEVVSCARSSSVSATLVAFGSAPKTLSVPVGPDVNSIFFADFNGDGRPDLAVAFDGNGASSPGGIAILLNTGNCTFASPVLYGTTVPANQFWSGGTPATRFAVLDLNHDGFLDIATASLGGTVSVFLGKGDGTFGAPTLCAVGGSGEAIAIADVNGDGNPDIVAGGTTGILLGNGNGTFHAGPPLPPRRAVLCSGRLRPAI